MAHQAPKNALIAVVGATGAGKSQVAVALAECLDGEIINGDAVQMYHGLPIATNKISREEMKGVPHHLLGCIRLDEQPWTVGRFVTKASRIIDDIHARGRVPILVGGTHYYTQSLIFTDVTTAEDGEQSRDELLEEKWPILKGNSEAMLEELWKVDPEMAARWHPNDTRKIRRSLEIWLQTGKKASELYAEQRSKLQTPQALGRSESRSWSIEEPNLFPGLRYDTLVLWVHAEKQILNERLNKRVGLMIEHGLLEEVRFMTNFLRNQTLNGARIDTSRGIWIAIGYKEFQEYLQEIQHGTTDTNIAALKEAAIERTKAATRQYAKRQVRWINLKLLPALGVARAEKQTFLLDGTQLEHWHENVEREACAIAEKFIGGKALPEPCTINAAARMMRPHLHSNDASPKAHGVRVCELCEVTTATENDWGQHLRSRKHKGLLRRQEKSGKADDVGVERNRLAI